MMDTRPLWALGVYAAFMVALYVFAVVIGKVG